MTEAPAFPRAWTEAQLRELEVLPSRGWVPADEVFHCDACNLQRWYWELHHLDPIGWGGPDSRLAVDRQVVWVRVCGDCHSTAHMILDVTKARGGWDEAWVAAFPHHYVEVARRGWQAYLRRLTREREAGGLAEAVARGFHERYEELAPGYGWETQPASRTDWHRLPPANRELMVATAERVLADFGLRQRR